MLQDSNGLKTQTGTLPEHSQILSLYSQARNGARSQNASQEGAQVWIQHNSPNGTAIMDFISKA